MSKLKASSIGLPPRMAGGKPVPPELQEYLDRLRRAMRVPDEPAIYSPLGITHVAADGGTYGLHLLGNLDGLSLSDGALDGRLLTIGDASGVYGVDYRELTSPTGSLSVTVTASELQIESNPSYVTSLTDWATLGQTLTTGDLFTIYDGSEAGLYKLDYSDLLSNILAAVPATYYQYVRDSGGTLLAQEDVLGITSPLKAVDASPDTTLKLAATAADKMLYSTGIDAWAEGSLSSYGRSLLDDANASACRDTLGASSGIWGLAVGGTNADLSATGGTSQFLRQSSAGAAVTVSAIAHADLGASGGTGTKYLRDDMSWQTVSAGVTGSGTTGTIPKWSGASALTDSLLSESGTLVSAAGDIRAYRTSATPGIIVGSITTPTSWSGEGFRAVYDFTTAKATILSGKFGTGYKAIDIQCSVLTVDQSLGAGAAGFRVYSGASVTSGIAIGTHASGVSTTGGEHGLQFTYAPATNLGTIRNALWGTAYKPIQVDSSILRIAPDGTADAYWSATGLMLGANSAPSRKLEVRSTSAQIRASYSASVYAELAVNSAGQLSITAPAGSSVLTMDGSTGTVIGYGANQSITFNSSQAIYLAGTHYFKSGAATIGTWASTGFLAIGASAYSASRQLEVRAAAAAQIRLSYDTSFYWEAGCSSVGELKWANNSTTTNAYGSIEFEATRNITGAVTDGYAASLLLDPGYTAASALTVTRHNYLDCQNVSVAGAGPAAVTDACLVRFDAAAGTHKATVGATTKTTPGGVDAWIKVNINGTIYYVPAYTSTTA